MPPGFVAVTASFRFDADIAAATTAAHPWHACQQYDAHSHAGAAEPFYAPL